MCKYILCLVSFICLFNISKAQLSIGVGYGRFFITNTDFEFDNVNGLSILTNYDFNKVRFGLSYSLVRDSKINEEWALEEFNRERVNNNNSKFEFGAVLSANARIKLTKRSQKLKVFLGGQLDIYSYSGSGEIELTSDSGNNTTTVGITDVRDGSVNLSLISSIEYSIFENAILFLDGGFPLVASSASIPRLQVGTLLRLTN